MNTQLNQAAISAEAQTLITIEEASHKQAHIVELATEIVDQDLTLPYGMDNEITVINVAEQLMDMSADGLFQFLPEDIANVFTGNPQALRQSMITAAEVLMTAHYDAIIKTIADQAAADEA